MKRRISLEVNDGFVLEFVNDKLWIRIDISCGQEMDINLEEVRELRDWLTHEVLKDGIIGQTFISTGPVVQQFPPNVVETLKITTNPGIRLSAGPTQATPELVAKQEQEINLENRVAMSDKEKSGRVYPNVGPITRGDQLELIDLSGQINKAVSVFKQAKIENNPVK